MWTSSISRIALSTSLAVAGGLSLVGVLISLPEPGGIPRQPTAALSSPASEPAGEQPDPATARQSPELAQAIDRVDAVLSPAPVESLMTAAPQGEPATESEPWSGTLLPDELGTIAPAAGRPLPGAARASKLPSEQQATAAAIQGERQEIAETPISAGETGGDKGAVPGAYVASTIHAGLQPPATPPEAAGQEGAMAAPAEAASAGPAGFIVIGSFRQHENAARHVKDHRTWLPQIQTKEVDGTLQYRVAIGPFRKADLAAARKRVVDSGIADAWLLPRDESQLATPPQSLDILG